MRCAATGMCRSDEPAVCSWSIRLPLQVSSARTGRPRVTDQGDLPDPRSLRLSTRSCAAAPRWGLGQNKTRRIYRELGLQFRNKTPKRFLGVHRQKRLRVFEGLYLAFSRQRIVQPRAAQD
jgi:hypothetical protein